MAEIFLGQVAIGDYRSRFLELIRARFGMRLAIHCGTSYFYDSLRTYVPDHVGIEWTRNLFFLQRRAVFQRNYVIPAIKARVAILELNPRVLNVWIVLFARRILSRPTILWGHAWPRAGSGATTDKVRGVMRRLASVLLVYTEGQKRELRERFSGLKIIAAPNALYSQSAMQAVVGLRDGMLYVGRLVTDKKVDLAIRAVAALRDAGHHPVPSLSIVGDGPERRNLERLVRQLCLEQYVHFHGHVSDPKALTSLYGQALVALSPGYAGLSLTQSFGFGVPVLIADHEPHAPEIEAAVDGFNCRYFRADAAESLAAVFSQVRDEREKWIARAERISFDCRMRYSAEVMAEQFSLAVVMAFNE